MFQSPPLADLTLDPCNVQSPPCSVSFDPCNVSKSSHAMFQCSPSNVSILIFCNVSKSTKAIFQSPTMQCFKVHPSNISESNHAMFHAISEYLFIIKMTFYFAFQIPQVTHQPFCIWSRQEFREVSLR